MNAVAESADAAYGVDAPHARDAACEMGVVAASGIAPCPDVGDRNAGEGGEPNTVTASSAGTAPGHEEGTDRGVNAVGASADSASAEVDAGQGGVSTPAAVIRPAELPHATQVASVSDDSLPQSGQSMDTS